MNPLLACPVCFGAAEGPLVNGSTLGILTLLVVTVAVLGAFGWFFLGLRRLASAVEGDDGDAAAVSAVGGEETVC